MENRNWAGCGEWEVSQICKRAEQSDTYVFKFSCNPFAGVTVCRINLLRIGIYLVEACMGDAIDRRDGIYALCFAYTSCAPELEAGAAVTAAFKWPIVCVSGRSIQLASYRRVTHATLCTAH